MNTYEFKAVLENMENSFEKVNHHLKTLRADPKQYEAIKDIWYRILQDCSIDDCTLAIQTIIRDENQPKTVEGYPRRIRAYATEMARGRRGSSWGATLPEDEYLRDCAERANAIRAKHGLPPLAEPYKRCTQERAMELAQEGRAAGMTVMMPYELAAAKQDTGKGSGRLGAERVMPLPPQSEPRPRQESVVTRLVDPDPDWPWHDKDGERLNAASVSGVPDDEIPFVWILTAGLTLALHHIAGYGNMVTQS